MKKILYICAAACLCACQTLPTSAEWKVRGDGYFQDGNPQKALQAYNRALQINPDNGAVYAARGAAYFFTGDYTAAQKDFEKLLEMNPYEPEGYSALGSVLAAQGYYQEALQVLNVALVLAPTKPEIFFSRGGVNFMLGEYDQAVADYSYVLNLRPAADVYNARGAAYLKLGDQQAADKDFAMAKSGQVPDKLNDYTMID